MGATWYDTIATLSWLAAQTTTTRLLSTVFNLTYRHPLVTAKSFATLDRLSDGRAIIGVGVGHVEKEFAALGVDFATRGKATDEALRVLDLALREGSSTAWRSRRARCNSRGRRSGSVVGGRRRTPGGPTG